MVKYCSNCGEELDDIADVCPECGVKTANPQDSTAQTVLSYLGSGFLLMMGLVCLMPTESYDSWYASGGVWLATAAVTLPPVKAYINENVDGQTIDRATSWGISILGTVLALMLVP